MADTPVVATLHAEGAKALIERIRALRAEVPRFVLEVPGEPKKLTPTATLDDGFMESASASIQKSPELETASGTDANTLRDSFGYALAYDAAVLEAFAFARSLAHTVRVQRATAGASALDIYAIAQRFAKRKNGAEFVPHVEDMRRKLKRGKKRKTTSEPAPVPPATKTP